MKITTAFTSKTNEKSHQLLHLTIMEKTAVTYKNYKIGFNLIRQQENNI